MDNSPRARSSKSVNAQQLRMEPRTKAGLASINDIESNLLPVAASPITCAKTSKRSPSVEPGSGSPHCLPFPEKEKDSCTEGLRSYTVVIQGSIERNKLLRNTDAEG